MGMIRQSSPRMTLAHEVVRQSIRDYTVGAVSWRSYWVNSAHGRTWYGVSGVLVIGKTDLRHILWSSFVMLTTAGVAPSLPDDQRIISCC